MDTVRQKLIMVGPWKCGKTEALMTFAHGRWFGDDYFRPGIFESYVTDTEVDGKHVELALTDTSGNEDYVRLRPLSYPDTRVVILAFAIDRPSSLEEACALWVSESTHYCPDAPTVLVGLKEDLRDHPGTIRELATTNQKPVSYQQGLAAARYIGAAAYAECSAKMVKGVQDVFKAAAQLALYSPDGTRKDVSWRHRLCSVM
ncbi:ras-domain-containing protein [Parathielavia appendiculata]|uniref:Ras-domain-containing protein n=1 Tax=Parathielavia appendiculata TaxID=2587402 RepID=A0AAN6YYX6_9PEZI|nr:ras-domain-containing protein [Parathielavia appendiculata]